MVTKEADSPSMCVKRKNKIIGTVKNNLERQALMRLPREIFPQGKVGDTLKVRVRMLIMEDVIQEKSCE